MSAIDFLRKKHMVSGKKQLSEVLESPNYTWHEICDLLEEYRIYENRIKVKEMTKIFNDKIKEIQKLQTMAAYNDDRGLQISTSVEIDHINDILTYIKRFEV